MEKVNVNKGLLAGLVAVAAGSLLAVAFLLGRSSGSGRPAGSPPQGSAAGTSGLESRPAGQPSPVRAPEEAPSAGLAVAPSSSDAAAYLPEVSNGSTGTRAGAPATSGTPAPPGDPATVKDPVASAVAKYLAEVDQIQPANLGGSAEGVAAELAVALARGDTSGLDAMIRQSESARVRLAAVRPPAPCAVHHEKSLESLDDALGMLRALKTSTQSADPAAGLAAVSARATILQARAEALQNEDHALRQRYGLAR